MRLFFQALEVVRARSFLAGLTICLARFCESFFDSSVSCSVCSAVDFDARMRGLPALSRAVCANCAFLALIKLGCLPNHEP